jgi:HAD superfamily hydrolase (TIGR01484 family)
MALAHDAQPGRRNQSLMFKAPASLSPRIFALAGLSGNIHGAMIRLLSTDFDGTLVNHNALPAVAPGLCGTFAELQRCGVLWAVNTGRDLNFILQGLRDFQFPIEPDYILTNEREVFHRNPAGQWQDYGDWNRRCIQAHDVLFEEESALVEKILHFFENGPLSGSVQPLFEKGRFIGAQTATDAEMDRVIAFLHEARAPDSLFHYQRNTIFLRFCHAHYSKGAVLGELCRLTGISAEETFSAGDHHNDLSMLDGQFAKWPAAPGNAIDEVKAAVQSAGGYVAAAHCGEGVLEALRHFFQRHRLAPEGYSLD